MNISKLIELLQAFQQANGDVAVVVDADGSEMDVKTVEWNEDKNAAIVNW